MELIIRPPTGPVHVATGVGMLIGVAIGAIALGYLPATLEQKTSALRSAWWIVVSTTILPLISFFTRRQPISGPFGGLINGLGSGLGLFLLFVGQVP